MNKESKRVGRFARCCLLLAFLATIAAAYLLAFPATALAQEEGPPAEGGQNMLLWLIHTSGLIGGFIFLLSFYFVAVVVQQFLELRESVAAPPELLAECDRLLGERNIQELYNVIRADESFFSKTLTVGITELQHGVDEAREKLERQADALTVDMERRISILAVLGTLGPMIGLLGTLKGMIASFSVIAISGVALKASEVAGGISEALVLTFEGVALSVPAIYFYALFRNRVSTITVKTTLLADDYLRSIARLAKPRAGAATS
jgi:biopolymer transport protein ExbB